MNLNGYETSLGKVFGMLVKLAWVPTYPTTAVEKNDCWSVITRLPPFGFIDVEGKLLVFQSFVDMCFISVFGDAIFFIGLRRFFNFQWWVYSLPLKRWVGKDQSANNKIRVRGNSQGAVPVAGVV